MRHVARQKWALWGGAGVVLAALAILLLVARAGASMPYNPVFEFTAISSSARSLVPKVRF